MIARLPLPTARRPRISCAAKYQVGTVSSGQDAHGVGLVGAVRAVVGLGVRAAVAAVAFDQAVEADGLVGSQEPDLVEEGAQGAPRVVGKQEIVAFGDDQRDLR